MTPDELARRAGLSTVRMIEGGWRNPLYGTALAIAEALGVTVSDLYAEPSPRRRNGRRRRVV